MKTNRIMFSVGELSGDKHAGLLVKSIKQQTSCECYGMGGQNMQKHGAELIIDSMPFATMGVIRVIRSCWTIFQAYRTMLQTLRSRRPDLLVLVNFSEFNLLLARKAKSMGIKVLYYIPPSVWAHGKRRLLKMRKTIDKAALIFPFEQKIYQQAHIDAAYVGNPTLEQFEAWRASHPAKDPAAEHCSSPLNDRQRHHRILLLPGSRKQEILVHSKIFCQTVPKIEQQTSKPIKFFVLTADGAPREWYQAFTACKNCTLIKSPDHYHQMGQADLALCVSGTATLELALFAVPTIIIYHLNAVRIWIIKQFITKIPWVGLPNIIAEKEVFPELLGTNASSTHISKHATRLLQDPAKLHTIKTACRSILNTLGSKHSSQETAQLALRLIAEA